MPNVTEHDNWRFTKENDEVERYLLRIIQRFFEVETDYSKESVEAMIVESLQRVKRWLATEKGFIFSFNHKTGHLSIDISFFGGEPAFKKNTAFNKDFGDQPDTICEGNDSRLSDAREPLTHHHEIDDIDGLRERIEGITFGDNGYYHQHRNKKVLDMLRYTGTRTQIDLILVEWLVERIEDYYGHLQSMKLSVKQIYDDNMAILAERYQELIMLLQDIKEYETTAVTWIEEAYKYIRTRIEKYNNNIMSKFVYYFTKERYDVIYAIYKKALQIFSDGEIPITDGTLSVNPVQTGVIKDTETDSGDSMADIYDSGIRIGNDDWTFDSSKNTFIYGHNESYEYQIFASISGYNKYCHRVTLASTNTDNDCISVILGYDPESNKHLSLVCVGGGGTCPYTANHGTTDAFWAVTDEYNPIGDGFQFDALMEGTLGASSGWSSMKVHVLVKREDSHFDIWVSRDTMPSDWNTYDSDGNINPTGSPTISFDANDYPGLSWIGENKLRYGYGNHSQAESQYLDVYFNGIGDIIGNETGYTEVSVNNEIDTVIDNPDDMITAANGKIKTYFRYEDENGNTNTVPIPFIFKTTDKQYVVIKTLYDSDGNIKIITNMSMDIPYYFTKYVMSGKYLIYAVDNRVTNDNIAFELSLELRTTLAKIENAAELALIKNNIINSTSSYWIFGIQNGNTFVDENGNEIFTDWDTGQPNWDVSNAGIGIVIDAHTGKMRTKGIFSKAGFLVKQKFEKLSDYFNNPRIYYQVTGNEEV